MDDAGNVANRTTAQQESRGVMKIQTYEPSSPGMTPISSGNGSWIKYADHLAVITAKAQRIAELEAALRAYMSLDHDDCMGTEYEHRCKACAAKKQARALLEAK